MERMKVPVGRCPTPARADFQTAGLISAKQEIGPHPARKIIRLLFRAPSGNPGQIVPWEDLCCVPRHR